MPLRFTFRQLEYLAAVGDAGTIARASERLNVSSPSISAAISQLEAEFGAQLFVRQHAQGLSLTPGGQRIFNEAKRILDSAGGLTDLANDIADAARGPIAVGALSTIAPMVSASVRRSFESAYPDASVSLREAHQADLLRMLGRAEIDVAITYDLEIPKDISFEPLAALPPYVMIRHDHALVGKASVTLDELAVEPMVLLDLPLSREYFLSTFQNAGFRPTISERTASLSVARSLVANGFGFCLINMRSTTTTAPDGEELTYLPLSGDHRHLVVGLATKRSEHRSRIVAAFHEHVQGRVDAGDLPGMGG